MCNHICAFVHVYVSFRYACLPQRQGRVATLHLPGLTCPCRPDSITLGGFERWWKWGSIGGRNGSGGERTQKVTLNLPAD